MSHEKVKAALPTQTAIGALLFEGLTKLAQNENDSDSGRANAGVRSLALVAKTAALQRAAGFDVANDKFQGVVRERFEAARAALEQVESKEQRDYLTRNLVEYATAPALYDGDLFLKQELEELVESIDDDDEYQLALFAYAMAAATINKPDPMRKLTARNEFKELLAKFDDPINRDAVSMEFFYGSYFADRYKTKDDARESFMELYLRAGLTTTTDEGFFKFSDEIPTRYVWNVDVDAVDKAKLKSFVESALNLTATRINFHDEHIRNTPAAQAIGLSVLSEEDREEKRAFARKLVVYSPAIANQDNDVELNLQSFIDHFDAFDMLDQLCATLDRAIKVARDSQDERELFFFPMSQERYEKALERYLNLADKVYRREDKTALDPKERASRLIRLARLVFLYDRAQDAKEKGRNAARAAMEELKKCDQQGDRLLLYRMLIDLHLEVKALKPAKKTLDMLIEEIESVDSELMRDFAKTEAFPYCLRLCEKEEIDAFAQDVSSRATAIAMKEKTRAEFAFRAYESSLKRDSDDPQEDRARVEGLSRELFETAREAIDAAKELDSELAVALFVELGTFFQERAERHIKKYERANKERKETAN